MTEAMPFHREYQYAFTSVHRIRPEAVLRLKAYLDRLGDDVKKQTEIPLADLRTLHFARWVVLDSDERYPPLLAFETNTDGDPADFLSDLVAKAPLAIERIYGACEGYEGGGEPARLVEFIRAKEVPTPAFHIAHRGKTVDSIAREAKLRDAIDDFFDASLQGGGFTAIEMRDKALADARSKGLLSDLPPPATVPPRWIDPLDWLKENAAKLVLGAVVLLPLVVVVGLALLVAYGYLRALEQGDDVDAIVRRPGDVRVIARREDVQVQNQLTHVVELKPGVFRWLLTSAVLYAIDLLARKRFNRGDLGGIPSIHFARWCFIDEGKRLLFFSNYDGTWESYLGDFIDKAHEGLTGVWSNTAGFPRTKNLVDLGALDEERFKNWTRAHQVHTQLWYSAYPTLSNADIATNAKIRAGVDGSMSAADACDWLALFAGAVPVLLTPPGKQNDPAPPRDEVLELGDIQSIVLTGHGRHRWSAFLAVHFPSRLAATGWIRSAAGRASCVARSIGDAANAVCTNIGFTWQGLSILGIDDGTLSTFPADFQEGMTTGRRPGILGDAEHDPPTGWEWGGPRRETVHALVLVYGRTETGRDDEVRAIAAELEARGARIVWENRSEMLGDRREHFGFVDGISQPGVRGYHDPADPETSDLLPAGEFVLGYRNAYGLLPEAPTLSDRDRKRVGEAGPAFERVARRGGFGENGTYLVVRQLYQDVARFRSFTEREGIACYGAKASDATELLAAKIVGRWRDGTPLATSPHGPTGDANNQFGFADDPQGMKCPVASHIRRSNPRDTALGATPEDARRVVNRHRILRRGRSYGPFLPSGQLTDDRKARGLVFMCVNANISRQFEFVQQTWVENRKFGGLHDDKDPLIARHDGGSLTIPESPLRKRIVPMQTLTRVRGGGYFFMPGLRALAALMHLCDSDG